MLKMKACMSTFPSSSNDMTRQVMTRLLSDSSNFFPRRTSSVNYSHRPQESMESKAVFFFVAHL